MKSLKRINAIAFSAMVLINISANLFRFGGKTTGQISEMYPNLLTPAPYTFAVWTVIYLTLTIFVLYQYGIGADKDHGGELRESVGIWFIVSCAFNIIWIFCWHFSVMILAMIAMIGLMISLIVINLKVNPRQRAVLWERLSIAVFRLYSGWIIAAALVNLSVLIGMYMKDPFSGYAQVWAVGFLIIGAIIVCLIVRFRRDFIAAAAIIWAYVGIAVKHMLVAGFAMRYPAVFVVTILSVIVMLVTIGMETAKRNYLCQACSLHDEMDWE